MKFATFNLRYDSKPDNITVRQSLNSLAATDPLKEPAYLALTGEQPWSLRRLRVAELLLREEITLAGFQEALIRQINDLKELFGDDWAWIGVGRDDGANKGEFCPIFYKRTMIELLSTDSFWLSTTPFRPSKYSGAGCIRVCTVARFKTINGGRSFTVLNTHLDHNSEEQRKFGASLLLHRAHFEAVNNDSPVFIMGDLNSSSTGNNSGGYKVVTGSVPPLAVGDAFSKKYPIASNLKLPSFRLLDLRSQAPRHQVSANIATFTDFKQPGDSRQWERIDFVFGGSNGGWKMGAYYVQSSLSDDGVLASDHRPVFVSVEL